MVEQGGDLAVGAYGIVNRVLFIFAMIVMGFNQGMQPIAGYNYGAQLYVRLRDVLYKTIFYATMVMTIGFVVCELFAEFIVQAFTTDAELIKLAARGMRIDVALFPIVGFQMVTGNFFQSIEQAGKSIYLSLTRQLIFLVPCLLVLPRIWGLDGVWFSLPVSDGLASLNAAVLLYMQIRKFKGLEMVSEPNETSWKLSFLRLPRRIQYFAANRVAPYLPLFSMFQPEDKKDEANRPA